jgi:hypothetical protein
MIIPLIISTSLCFITVIISLFGFAHHIKKLNDSEQKPLRSEEDKLAASESFDNRMSVQRPTNRKFCPSLCIIQV